MIMCTVYIAIKNHQISKISLTISTVHKKMSQGLNFSCPSVDNFFFVAAKLCFWTMSVYTYLALTLAIFKLLRRIALQSLSNAFISSEFFLRVRFYVHFHCWLSFLAKVANLFWILQRYLIKFNKFNKKWIG